MKVKCGDFRVPPGNKVNLRTWPTTVRPLYKTKRDYTQHRPSAMPDLTPGPLSTYKPQQTPREGSSRLRAPVLRKTPSQQVECHDST